MILAMIWMFFIIVLIFIILVRNWQLLKMFPLSKKNVSSISSRVPPSLRASRVPSSVRASRVPPSLRASRAPPGQQSPQDIFFWGGATRPRSPLICYGPRRPQIRHGRLSPLIRRWSWNGHCPGGHQSCLHDPWGHQRCPPPLPIGCCTVRDAGGPVSPCLVTPFLKCPYMVLPVSCSLLVQLVPAVCLDCVPGI